MGKLLSYSNKIGILITLDHVDLCSLIVTLDLQTEYGKNNNFDIVTEFTFQRIHSEYYKQCNVQKKEKPKK
jgi:hypothetical protein